MIANRWYGKHDVRVESVPDPEIVNERDAIVRVTSTAICGSDLHLYDRYIPTMKKGDILGHEFMGEVIDVGSSVTNLRPGDRVVVPFNIACGSCYYCAKQMWSLCDNSNPNPLVAELAYGQAGAGLFGYSHMMGGYAGGQAQLVRVPYADVGCLKIEDGLPDDMVLFLSDIFPTGYMAAEVCDIQPGDVIAVFGCGPIGQFAIRSALLLGAERVLAIDDIPERLAMAAEAGAEIVPLDDSMFEEISDRTGGRGADACIDAVGMEAHGVGIDDLYDKARQTLHMQTDRPSALRYAIQVCRKGGIVSLPGVYGGVADKLPIGAAFGKGLTLKMGQTHVHRYMKPLLRLIEDGKIDPSFVITHRLPLFQAPEGYEMFHTKRDGCIKVVLQA
jgi:threonine dehydrogenase-like Zn-dependent dehydrogenase